MDDNDFYEDDESIEERKAAWKAGERGVTQGSRDLDLRAKSVVDSVAARWDADEPVVETQQRRVVFGKISPNARHLVTTAGGLGGTRT